MSLTYGNKNLEFSDGFAKITKKTKELIKSRTVERDFRFIDQSDAVVVIYPTEKISPGVLAEIIYAHRNQKPVFMYFTSKTSPFLENYVTYLTDDLENLMTNLEGFSNDK
ncbi:MAG: nucleoside 2-deoxyribosyltransferase [Flavobacteriaceae bacterium]|nr:nucleoside 2-deoxyribosyltransferase [Flavobacteriaceae bacterium]